EPDEEGYRLASKDLSAGSFTLTPETKYGIKPLTLTMFGKTVDRKHILAKPPGHTSWLALLQLLHSLRAANYLICLGFVLLIAGPLRMTFFPTTHDLLITLFLVLLCPAFLAMAWRIYMSDLNAALILSAGMLLYFHASANGNAKAAAWSGMLIGVSVYFRYSSILGLAAIGLWEIVKNFTIIWTWVLSKIPEPFFLLRRSEALWRPGRPEQPRTECSRCRMHRQTLAAGRKVRESPFFFILCCFTACFLALIPLLCYHWHFFGHLLHTGYARNLHLSTGRPYFGWDRAVFSLKAMLQNLASVPQLVLTGFPFFWLLPACITAFSGDSRGLRSFLWIWISVFSALYLAWGVHLPHSFVFSSRKFLPVLFPAALLCSRILAGKKPALAYSLLTAVTATAVIVFRDFLVHVAFNESFWRTVSSKP
ncbi:MAG: hypothetical protein PHQ23_15085, partial [Candidatus Wallbacteria bacterium]|nr:hypothetical protein [Candidatus Wallbacteria bacterium]